MESHNRIVRLIAKKVISTLNGKEQREIDRWTGQSEQNRRLYNEFIDSGYLSKKLEEANRLDTEASWQRFQKKYAEKQKNLPTPSNKKE